MSEISLSVDAVSELIEEIRVLRAENDRLRAQVERLSGPVSDEANTAVCGTEMVNFAIDKTDEWEERQDAARSKGGDHE